MKLSILSLAISLLLASSVDAKKAAIAAAAAVSSAPASSPPAASAPVSSASTPTSAAGSSNSPVAVNLPPTGSVPAGPIQTAPVGTAPACPGGCTWPTWDQPPPEDPAWVNLVDLTKIPACPINNSTQPGTALGEPINPGYTATNDPWCSWGFTQCVRPSDIVQCPKGSWGLTYDDGPSPYSPFLEAVLDQNQQKATRFIIGSRALEYPEALKAMCDAGHQIGIHTFSHPYMTTMNDTTVIAELKWTERIIQAICGVTPRFWRPPHGDVDDRVRYIAAALGYRTVIWNKDSGDWEVPVNPGPTDFQPSWVDGNITIWANTLSTATTGIITLEHELSQAEAGESVICYPIIKKGGWNIQTVADCVGDPAWYVEWENRTTASSSLPAASAGANSTAAPNSANITSSAKPSNPSNKSGAGRNAIGVTLAMGAVGALVALAL